MAFLEMSRLRKRFGSVEVLRGIDITLEKGGFLVLVGPSGCGKSTLLNAIAGLETPDEGSIAVDGRAIDDLSPAARDVAMVFQSYALYPTMSVARNLAFGLKMRGVARAERERAVAEVARLLQIGPLLKRRPHQLSGGQRQRVAMGRALVRKPRLFLMDEPLSNLDAKLRIEMRTEIKRIHQTTGATIVYVTHDQVEAMTLGTKIVVLSDGEIQQTGTPAEVYNTPANLFVAKFMGSPAMNLIEARVARRDGRTVLTIAGSNVPDAVLPAPEIASKAKLAEGQVVVLGIRPEAITGPHGLDRSSPRLAIVEAPVDVIEPAGADTFVVTAIAGHEVIARFRASEDLRLGSLTHFAFDLTAAVLFDPQTTKRL